MPEIIHEYNSLLGSDPDELCDLVLRVLNDQRLRQKLAKNGLKTLKKYFHPPKITNKI